MYQSSDELDFAISCIDETYLPSIHFLRTDGTKYASGLLAANNHHHANTHVENLMHFAIRNPAPYLQ